MSAFETAANDPALRQLLAEALKAVDAAEGSILLVSADGERLRFVVAQSAVANALLGLEQPLEKGIVGRSVSSQQPTIVNEAEQEGAFDPSVDARTGVRTKSIMVVPLLRSARAIGALTAINSTAPAGFSENDLKSYTQSAEEITRRLAQLGES